MNEVVVGAKNSEMERVHVGKKRVEKTVAVETILASLQGLEVDGEGRWWSNTLSRHRFVATLPRDQYARVSSGAKSSSTRGGELKQLKRSGEDR